MQISKNRWDKTPKNHQKLVKHQQERWFPSEERWPAVEFVPVETSLGLLVDSVDRKLVPAQQVTAARWMSFAASLGHREKFRGESGGVAWVRRGMKLGMIQQSLELVQRSDWLAAGISETWESSL